MKYTATFPEDFYYQWVHPNGKELQLQQEINILKDELKRVRELARNERKRFLDKESELYASIRKANDTILDLRVLNHLLISNDK